MKNLLETSPIGVAVLSPSTAERLYINRSFAKMLGADSLEALESQDVEDSWLDKARRQEFKDILITGRSLVDFEAERSRLDGSSCWILMNSHLIEFDGQPAHAIWHNDISEIVTARSLIEQSNEQLEIRINERTRELQHTQEKFRLFSEAASDWFWETDTEMKFSNFSNRMEEVTGIAPEAHIGKTRAEMAGENIANDKWQKHLKVMEEHKPFRDFRYERKGQNGKLQYFSTSGKPIFDAMGVFAGYVGVGTDLTEQREAADQAKIANERLAAAIEAMSEVFALWDASGRLFIGNKAFMEANKAMGEKLQPGLPYSVFVEALADFELVPEAEGKKAEWIAERTERHYHPTGPFEQKRGDGRWFMISEQRFTDGSIATISTEISRLKHAESLLKQSQERFRDFASVAADWYWEQDANLKFTDISKDNKSVAGMSRLFFIGKTRWETNLIEVSDADKRAHISQIEARLPFSDFHCARRGPDNKIMYMSINGKPTFDETGAFSGYRGAGRDITEIVEAQKSVMEERDRAETANRSKTDFLANMSHELRTPLNSIIGYSQMIKGEFVGKISNPKYLEYANDIYTSGQHLLLVIGDILDISKVEAGEVAIEETEVEIRDTVDAAVMIVELLGKSKGQQIDVNIPTGISNLWVDDRLVRQILINLLSNAIKFTPEGGRVEITAVHESESSLSICVRDTGIGIAVEDFETAFEPFGQIRIAPELTHEGTGLGLSLSKRLMELHGGSIAIDSVLGEGTTVTVTFPQERILTWKGRDGTK